MSYYGIIGKPLEHSYSPGFYKAKFSKSGLKDYRYQKFELNHIDEFPDLITQNPDLKGLNVTSPYKEAVLPFLDILDKNAKFTGAANLIKIKHTSEGKKLHGFNTDVYGFEMSLLPLIKNKKLKALIFGTGGGSRAAEYVLKKNAITFEIVTRRPLKANQIVYWSLDKHTLKQYKLLINTTPLGMYPKDEESLPIPYDYITNKHIAYDMIYNPEETVFLKHCKQEGALTVNGLKMFLLQAEKNWEIWNSAKY